MTLGFIVLTVSFVVLLIVDVPVALALVIPAMLAAIVMGFDPLAVLSQFKNGVTNQSLLAIFTFVALGVFTAETGVAAQLIRFSDTIVGHIKGGLGIALVVASTFYGALTGSVTGTVAAIGGIGIEGMTQKGYPRAFSAGLAAVSGILGSLIPPSIGVIVYGVVNGTSIMGGFMALLGPGILMSVLLCIATYIISRRRGFGGHERVSFSVMGVEFIKVLPALIIPVGVLVGIYLGVTSATEAGILGVFASVVIGLICYKLKIKSLANTIINSCLLTSIIMFVTCGSFALGYILTYTGALKAITQALLAISDGLVGALIMINLFLLVMGCFIEMTALVILLSPIVSAVLTNYGMDPLHVMSIFIFNCLIGFITPPVGTALFTASAISREELAPIVKEALPYYLVAAVCIVLIVLFPDISIFIPRVMGLA